MKNDSGTFLGHSVVNSAKKHAPQNALGLYFKLSN